MPTPAGCAANWTPSGPVPATTREARRSPRVAAALLVGLIGYGFSMALMVRAGLGLDPWDVFHQGLSRHTG